MVRDFYTVVEAACELGVDHHWIYAWIHEGTFPACRVGGKWVIPKKKFERWQKDHENPV